MIRGNFRFVVIADSPKIQIVRNKLFAETLIGRDNDPIRVLKPFEGITAIEDRLQAGVPEAIQALRDAGLAVWVLTGDKLQTATEIGRSCNLIGQKDHVEFIKNDTRDKLRLQLAGLYSNVEDVRRFSKKKSRGDMRRCWSWLCEETPKLERIKGRVLVIDGKNLGWIFEDKVGFQIGST